MGKWVRQFAVLLGTLLLLTGCMSQSVEDFYVPPQLPEDYLTLQTTIAQVMSELSAEYAAPAAGTNVQNIQLQDLDGDGVQESAVAFFRVSSDERPLKIYIFRQNQSTEDYEVQWIIEGTGTGIYSVYFEDLGGTPEKELVVSWQISANAQSLTAYSLQPSGEVVELMRSGYAKGALVDMDQDNKKEIVLAQLDTAENNSRVELYNYNNGAMVLTSTAPLSMSITNILSAKEGCLTNQAPALFVSSDFGENGGRVTDILTVQGNELVNLTLDTATGISTYTVRYYKDFKDLPDANGMDINNDGILELPIPEELPLLEESDQMYIFHWNQYGPDGSATRVCTTFHCYEDGWYLTLPDEWVGQITAVRRDGAGSSASTERGVGFLCWPEGAQEPEEFLTIYRLTGTNRSRRAVMDGRFTILESKDIIFAAKLHDTQWDCGVDKEGIQTLFSRVRVSWSVEN